MKRMKVVIIHDTMSIQAYRDAFAHYNVTLEEWISDETPVDITEEPPKDAIFYNKPSGSSHDRGHRYSLEQSRTILRWLHKHGRTVINGLTAVEFEESKSYQYLCAKENGLPVPKTFTASVITEDAIRSRFGEDTPFIVKPDRGAKGIDVRFYETLSAFVEDKKPKKYPGGLFLVQKYIPSEGGIYRAEFIGGRYIYTSLATIAERGEQGDFWTNTYPRELSPMPIQYKIFKDFNHPIIKLFENFIRNVGIENAGIEFLFDVDGQPHVIDVNTNTNYKTSAEKEVGLESGFVRVAKYIHERLLKLQESI